MLLPPVPPLTETLPLDSSLSPPLGIGPPQSIQSATVGAFSPTETRQGNPVSKNQKQKTKVKFVAALQISADPPCVGIGWGCGFMEGVVSRQFPLSEHPSVCPSSVHPFFIPSSPHIWILLSRVKTVSSHYFLRQLQRHWPVQWSPTLLSLLRRGRTGGWGPSGIRCHMELSTSCDIRPCSQSCLASRKSYSDGGQRVM